MGFIPEPTPDMGEFSVEVRRESFYLGGAPNFVWWRPAKGRPMPEYPVEGEGIEIREDGHKPRGDGWMAGYVQRRHGIIQYRHGDTGQITAEILIEDIPKIRAALDQVERVHNGASE